jgi:hypothetical protein
MRHTVVSLAIAAMLALPAGVASPVAAATPEPTPAPAREAPDAPSCALGPESAVLLAGSACCQREGGMCGCRDGKARCCNGTASTCACRADTPPAQGAAAVRQ